MTSGASLATVLSTYGILPRAAVRARIVSAFGHIRLVSPTGAMPNGAA